MNYNLMSEEAIEKLFTYRRWTPEELEVYRPLREHAKALALEVLHTVPECPQRTRAINALHEAVYLINTAATLYPLESK